MPNHSRSRRRSTLIAAGVLGLAVLGAGTVALAVDHADRPVSVVDGRAISADEIRFQMALLDDAVSNAVRTGAVPAADADDELRERALEQSLRDAQLFGLARDRGLIGFDDFDGFLRSLEEENDSRAAALAAGEIVYGTTEFSAPEYYSRTTTLLRTELTDVLSEEGGPLHVTDADVRAYYDANAADWAAEASTWSVRSLSLPATAAEDAVCAAALAAAPPSLGAVETACGATATDSTLDGAADLPAGSPAAEALASVQGLEAGGTSAPVVADGEVHLYQLVSMSVDSDAAYELYADRIRSVVVSDRLDGYLDDLISTASPVTDEALLSTIEPKD
ncbi:peptidyl-prolyl cis-trans isomerase [Rathayibacter sp. Leaf248]|uniref:peptidyl-prolyl cis-trans isomerase n=1 Tax=Rathayibacter sp. Leaf248 TaxID=2876555 RepID=UPI001E554EDB|nr:peptidyl-prolyl cis-trans isomerase [Rathayibacter sp. Leaf248]